jgi:hypothetical protein
MKKILVFIIALVCPAYVACVEFGLKDYLNKKFPDYTDIISWSIFVLGIIAIAASYIMNVYKPEERYEKAKIARSKYLRSYADKVNEGLESKKYPVFKFNIMVVKQQYRSKEIYPKRNDVEGNPQLSFFPKIFECIWTSGENDHVDILLGIKQGTSGIALKEKRVRILGLFKISYEDAKKEMKLNKKQFDEITRINEKTETRLALLISAPIKVKKKTPLGEKSVTIAILNAESDNEFFGRLMSTNQTFTDTENESIKIIKNQLLTMMEEFTKTCSDLYF